MMTRPMRKVAIKIINLSTLREPYVIKNLTREAKLLAKLQHPGILCLYETIRCNSSYYLVTELATGGDLYTHIKKQPSGHLDETTAKCYARQLVSALDHIHRRGIVHRDLKMENIMLKDHRKKHIKIIDFGLSNWSAGDKYLETHCGSPEYAAPELFLIGRKYGAEVDLWSLGIILFGMVTGQLPFSTSRKDKTSPEQWRRKLMAQIFRGLTSLQEKKISVISSDYKNLVKRLLEPIVHRRIRMIDIRAHPWLRHNDDNVSNALDNLRSNVQETIYREINATTRQCTLAISEKIRLEPYGEFGGIFNIKAHESLGTGSVDVFRTRSSSFGQNMRIISRSSSSGNSANNAASRLPNNCSVEWPTILNFIDARSRISAYSMNTVRKEAESTENPGPTCTTFVPNRYTPLRACPPAASRLTRDESHARAIRVNKIGRFVMPAKITRPRNTDKNYDASSDISQGGKAFSPSVDSGRNVK